MKRYLLLVGMLWFGIFTFAQKLPVKPSQTVVDTRSTSIFSIDKIFPNPVINQVEIIINSEKDGPLEFSLINIVGNEVKKWEIQAVLKGWQTIKFDLSSYQSGIYFLKISGFNQIQTRVIKKV